VAIAIAGNVDEENFKLFHQSAPLLRSDNIKKIH